MMINGKYILIIPPDIYPGKRYRNRYAYEHHVIFWQNTGIIPKENELIHHKDENTRHNEFDNLELKTRSAHNIHHSRGKQMITLTCGYCGIIFERELHRIKPKLKDGQTRFFCCRSHQVILQQRELRIKL